MSHLVTTRLRRLLVALSSRSWKTLPSEVGRATVIHALQTGMVDVRVGHNRCQEYKLTVIGRVLKRRIQLRKSDGGLVITDD